MHPAGRLVLVAAALMLTLFVHARLGMGAWRDKLFVFLSKNARRATNFFQIPPDRVVEIGIQLEL